VLLTFKDHTISLVLESEKIKKSRLFCLAIPCSTKQVIMIVEKNKIKNTKIIRYLFIAYIVRGQWSCGHVSLIIRSANFSAQITVPQASALGFRAFKIS